jgi:hypothetical protein
MFLSYLIKIFNFNGNICKICNYQIEINNNLIICKKCKCNMHKNCFLNKNGERNFTGCINCNELLAEETILRNKIII